MRRSLPLLILGGWLALLPALADAPVVRLVDFEATVNPISANRILQSIDDAERDGDELVLIVLDTPGGLVASMETLIKRMLSSKVPVVVWVGPAGARAASAGFYILLAADFAAMAPGTRTGAASVVAPGADNQKDNVVLKKANEDLAALIRSLAERRGRDVAASEEAVFSAKAYEETVALEKGLIDLIVVSKEELLEQLDGREIVRFDGTRVTLRTAGAQFATSEFNIWQEVMEIIGHPTVAYLLLLLGMLGLYVEFTNPGLVFPGVAGALCLLLFALASQVLPVSSIGILLILLSIVMFILEIKVISYGMLTVGGIISLVLGSVLLIDGPIPELRVPWPVVLPTSILVAGLCIVALRFAVQAQRARVGTGVEGLVGELGIVERDLDPEGKVSVHGEIWNASSPAAPLPRGTRVRVDRVQEMMLTVTPAEREAKRGIP